MAGKRKYFDLSYMFMRGLQAHEQMQRGKHYLKSAAECTSKAIVSLELSEKNVNTAKQAARLESIGQETVRRLEGYVNSHVYSSDRPAPGRFVSSAGAILVALLNLTELAAADSQGGVVLISEEELRNEAVKICDEKFLPLQSPGFCQAWWRLEVLIKRDLIKRRSLHKANVYHLLPLGMDKALSLREKSLGQEPATAGIKITPSAITSSSSSSSVASPSRSRKRKATEESPSIEKKTWDIPPKSTAVSPSSSFSSSSVATAGAPSTIVKHPVEHVLTDAMYSNDKGQNGVILLVDIQECGGNAGGLAELCEMIEQTGTVYRTRKLPCADYNWLWRCDGVERQLPFLLERKRADDVAFSLKDGRFWRQIDKMTSQKDEFHKKKGMQATLQYVIEGKPERFVVRCADGCQGVGRCGNPSLQQVQRVLCDLEQHPHLEVVAMDSMLDTVRHLAETTSHLRNRAERGEFDALVISEMTAVSAQEPDSWGESKTGPVLVLSDSDDDSMEHTPCQQNNLNIEHELQTQELAEMFKGSHSSLPLLEEYDELPPLVPPLSARRQQCDVNKENRSVGQTAKQTCGASPVPLTTLGGSPRGRVYLMKRKADKFGQQISPNKPPTGCGERNDAAVTGRNTTDGTALGTGWASCIEDGTGERERLGDSATLTGPKHSAFEPQFQNLRDDSSSVFGVTSGHCEGSEQGRLSPRPSVCSSTANRPNALENLSPGLKKSVDHISPVSVSLHQLHGHPDIEPKEQSVFLTHDVSVGGSCYLKQNVEEHLTTIRSTDNALCNDESIKNNSVVVRSLAEHFSHSVKSSPSHTDARPEISSRVRVQPLDYAFTMNSGNGEKDAVGMRYSDNDGSDSLPDIDLCMGFPQRPLQMISSPASPCHVTASQEDQEREITSWPGGGNSEEKKNGAAPRPPQTANTHVQPADKIAQIAAVFPQMRGSQIVEVLRRFDGDVERSVIGILEDPGFVGV